MSASSTGLGSLVREAVSLGLGRRASWVWGAVIMLALVIASILSMRLAESLIDVGVDVDPKFGPAPQLFERAGDKLLPLPELARVGQRYCAKGTHRYHTRIPRSALGQLVLDVGENESSRVQRLFIATWNPRIFYGASGRPEYQSWRGAHEVWQPLPLGTGQVELPPLGEFERGGARTFAALALLALFLTGSALTCISVLLCAFRWLRRNDIRSEGLAPFSWRPALFFALPALPIWLFYLASYFPGTGSLDVDAQWAQAKGLAPLSNAHPAFHTLTLRWLSSVWDSPAAVALAQIFCMAALLGYAFSLLWRTRVPRPAILVAYVLTILSPRVGFMSILLWKDLPYSVMCVALAVLLAHLLLAPKLRERRAFWIALTLALTLVPSFRHNGFLVTLGVGALLPLAFWHLRRQMLIVLVSTVVLLGFIRVMVEHGYKVEFGDRYFSRNNVILLNALLAHQDVPLTPEEAALIDETLGLETLRVDYEWWDYDRPPEGENMRWRHYSVESMKAAEEELFALSSSLALRYASYALRYFGASTNLPYTVFAEPKRAFRKIAMFPIAGHPHEPLIDGGMELLDELYKWTAEDRNSWAFWRTGWHLYLTLATLVVVLVRRRDPRWILVFLGFYLNTLSLTLALASPHVRYQFPLVLGTGFLVCLAFLPRSRVERVDGQHEQPPTT